MRVHGGYMDHGEMSAFDFVWQHLQNKKNVYIEYMYFDYNICWF